MLAYLLNTPRTPQEWSIWSFAHRDQHLQIIQVIQSRFGVTLQDYPVDPIVLDAFPEFLEANQRLHTDFNGVLQTQSSDLSEVDPTNHEQLTAWIYLHRREHETAAAVLGIG